MKPGFPTWMTGMKRMKAVLVTLGAAGMVTGLSAAPALAAPTSGRVNITAAPVHIATTAEGHVAYRAVGSGPALVLLMGFSGTMDDWAPSFVDQLGANFHVVVPDNAGVGKTAALPRPLTITAMANQVSALISTLGLHRPAVLGWSMGGMIAQALAVLHPAQVSHLVLAATQAGTGKALPVPPAAQAKAASSNGATVLSVLFPPSQVAAARAYGLSLFEYPAIYLATPTVKAEQTRAIGQWLAGADAAGRAVGKIHVPTLVADGTEDALDPVANDHLLAKVIHGAQLVLYPGAGHGFLFQDEGQFVPRVKKFLG